MKLKELKESYDPIKLNLTLDELAGKIKTECKVMYEACKKSKRFLYRGMAKQNEPILQTRIRPDRIPVEMPLAAHKLINKTFVELGYKTNRENCIFCTADLEVARTWGPTYFVFVKDGWNGLYFKETPEDYSFYFLIGKSRSAIRKNDSTILKNAILDLKPSEFKSSSTLASLMKKRYHEILISGDSYFAIRLDLLDKLREKLEI